MIIISIHQRNDEIFFTHPVIKFKYHLNQIRLSKEKNQRKKSLIFF